MGLSVNTNVAAINAYRNLSATQTSLSKSLEKLSSGFRINRAADDAAGLAISEGLRSQISGLTQAARNAQDGISVVQTAEGALTEVHSILHRMRDLAVQAANDSNSQEARANIVTEATQLQAELDRIALSTNFNGTTLLDKAAGSAGAVMNFQVGADGDGNSRIAVDLSSANVSSVAADAAAMASYDSAVAAYSQYGADLAAWSTAASSAAAAASDGLGTWTLGASTFASEASFIDAWAAADSANAAPTVVTDPGSTPPAATAAGLNLFSHTGAQDALNKINAQIDTVSTARANLGAYQNRFEHTINSVNVAVENLSASESRIRDTDMASEMVNFTKAQILSQAGVAMLAQANTIPQGVLQLLR